MAQRPSLIIIAGLPGAGKTTLARRLAGERPGVRLCPDDWLAALGSSLWNAELRERVERLQFTLALELLRCRTTAIIEWGTWAVAERDALRSGAHAAGAAAELIVLDPPLETLWARITARGLEDPPITHDALVEWDALFQRPDAAEAAGYDAFSLVR